MSDPLGARLLEKASVKVSRGVQMSPHWMLEMSPPSLGGLSSSRNAMACFVICAGPQRVTSFSFCALSSGVPSISPSSAARIPCAVDDNVQLHKMHPSGLESFCSPCAVRDIQPPDQKRRRILLRKPREKFQPERNRGNVFCGSRELLERDDPRSPR